jgi:hypothetical protein
MVNSVPFSRAHVREGINPVQPHSAKDHRRHEAGASVLTANARRWDLSCHRIPKRQTGSPASVAALVEWTLEELLAEQVMHLDFTDERPEQ